MNVEELIKRLCPHIPDTQIEGFGWDVRDIVIGTERYEGKMTTGELIRELSYWSPDTKVLISTPSDHGIPVGSVEYEDTLNVLTIFTYEGEDD